MKKMILVDDLDPNDIENVQTVTFSFQGYAYEIDLSARHTADLAKALTPYIRAARPAQGAAAKSSGSRKSRSSVMTQVRAWARDKGIEIGERGRIPANVVEQYYREVGK